MDWTQQVFNYCERGADGGLWAEPLNAVTNVFFLFAAGLAARKLLTQQRDDHPTVLPTNAPMPNRPELPAGVMVPVALIIIVTVIGFGSAAFHIFATRWAALCDVAPIGLFMLAYMAVALRQFVGLSRKATLLGVMLFALACYGAASVTCNGAPCLNGSVGYLPALLGMLGIGAWLLGHQHKAARALLTAGVIFAISITLRMVDMDSCGSVQIGGYVTGTHYLWHIANAMTLYLLLVAAIEHTATTPRG